MPVLNEVEGMLFYTGFWINIQGLQVADTYPATIKAGGADKYLRIIGGGYTDTVRECYVKESSLKCNAVWAFFGEVHLALWSCWIVIQQGAILRRIN